MNKNRDMFIDLMGEIDEKHLETHVKKNTDTKTKLIKRYIIAAGMYAAACVAVLVMLSVIINYTGNVQPKPGTQPVTGDIVTDKNDAIDEFFADTKLYKVLNTAGVKRGDVESLQVGDHQIVDGEVYYLFDGIYKNTEESPIYTKGKKGWSIESFMVTGDYIICEVYEDVYNGDTLDLYCYNMKTGEEILVCNDDIYHYDVYDGKVVYLTADSINNIKNVKVYTYDPEANKSTFVCDLPDTHHYIVDISYTGSELAITTDARCFSSGYSTICQATVLDMETKDLRDLFTTDSCVGILITDSDEGYYVSCQKKIFDEGLPSEIESEYNGVWYTNVGEDPVKISDTYYREFYYVNGTLIGVNGDEYTLIDTDPDIPKETIPVLEEYKNIPVYWADRSVSVFEDVAQGYKNGDSVPEMYIVRFEESPSMVFVMETRIDPYDNTLWNTLIAIYVDDYKYECSIDLFVGTGLDVIYTNDIMCVIRQGASVPGDAVFVCKNGAKQVNIQDGYCVFAENDGNVMKYRFDSRKIYGDRNQLVYWAWDKNATDVYRTTGQVIITDTGIQFAEETSMTLEEYYLTAEMENFREKVGCETFDEFKEYCLAQMK